MLTFALREDLDEISLDCGQVVILPKDTARTAQVVQQGLEKTSRRVCEVDVSLRVYGEAIERGALLSRSRCWLNQWLNLHFAAVTPEQLAG